MRPKFDKFHFLGAFTLSPTIMVQWKMTILDTKHTKLTHLLSGLGKPRVCLGHDFLGIKHLQNPGVTGCLGFSLLEGSSGKMSCARLGS